MLVRYIVLVIIVVIVFYYFMIRRKRDKGPMSTVEKIGDLFAVLAGATALYVSFFVNKHACALKKSASPDVNYLHQVVCGDCAQGRSALKKIKNPQIRACATQVYKMLESEKK